MKVPDPERLPQESKAVFTDMLRSRAVPAAKCFEIMANNAPTPLDGRALSVETGSARIALGALHLAIDEVVIGGILFEPGIATRRSLCS